MVIEKLLSRKTNINGKGCHKKICLGFSLGFLPEEGRRDATTWGEGGTRVLAKTAGSEKKGGGNPRPTCT
jgi:hypothetical protein